MRIQRVAERRAASDGTNGPRGASGVWYIDHVLLAMTQRTRNVPQMGPFGSKPLVSTLHPNLRENLHIAGADADVIT